MADKTVELRSTTNFNQWPVEKRKLALGEIFVSTPQIKSILKKIEHCHHQSKYYGNPQCCYITGESGMGKSNIGKHYKSLYPTYDDIDSRSINRIVPVLYSKIPILATPKSLPGALLSSMGDIFHDSGTEPIKTERLKGLIVVLHAKIPAHLQNQAA